MAAKMFKKIFGRKGKKEEKMADSSEAKPGTSLEFIDPYCVICYEVENIKIRAEGYCPECDQCLCKDCLSIHARLPSNKRHVVRTGKDLSKSQSDEPPRFESSPLSTAESSFPTLSEGLAAGYQPSDNGEQMKDMNAVKWEEYNISLRNEELCWITGLAVTGDGRRLLADWRNKKIKMFSQDMKIISSLSLPENLPQDIAVTGDREAVVSAWYRLYILDVSDQQLSVRETVRLSFVVEGIATCRDRLVVTSPLPSPASVKLIDQRGKVYWSTSTDQQRQNLFFWPFYMSCCDDGRSSTVIVTDCWNHTLTLLNSDTGEVIRRREVERKWPTGVTTDRAGNIYVYYQRTREVAMWTGDLAEGKILLTLPWSKEIPAIVYDTVAEELVVIHDIEDE